MKRFIALALVLSVLTTIITQAQNDGANAPSQLSLKTTRDQASYAIGVNIGRDLKSNGAEINSAALIQGIKDIMGGAEPALTDEQCNLALQTFQREMTAKMEQERKVAATVNKREGDAFLAQNKTKEGVVTLPSGLQYTVLKRGAGPSPTVSDTVETHYHGTLLSGVVFDSSVERNEPAVFPVGGVIRGWTEALQLMKVGDKFRLYVPSELAYGAQGRGPVIGPNAVLVFDVELLDIK